MFENQRALGNEELKQYAADVKLDTAAFDACFDSGKFRDVVQRDYAEGEEKGVNATPTFFINGRFLSGAQPFDAFKAIIDEEIEND